MALGGIFAALAVVIMSMGGLIPVATFVCPMFCMILLRLVSQLCGRRIGWTWYGAVAILGLLLGPDKEAAAVFVVIGHYPVWKPVIDRSPLKWLLKVMFFNGSILALYWVMLHLLGLNELSSGFDGIGVAGMILMLLMGNIIFFMLDKLLSMRFSRGRK